MQQYLVEQRGLPKSIVDELHSHGTLYADSKQNAVFFEQKPEGTITGANLHSTEGGDRLQALAQGTDKESGWFSLDRGQGQLERIVLVESPIEAISAAALAKQTGVTLFAAIDEVGETSAAWLMQQQSAGVQVLVGYGTHPTGEQKAQQVIGVVPGAVRVHPSYGHKDWNEQLIRKVALTQQVEQLSDQEFVGLGQWVAEYFQTAPQRPPSVAEQQQVHHQIEQLDQKLEQLQTQQAAQVAQVGQMQNNPLCAWNKNYQDAVLQLQKTVKQIDSTQSQKNQQQSQLQLWAKLAQVRSNWEKEPQTTQVHSIAEVLNLPQMHQRLDRIQQERFSQQAELRQQPQQEQSRRGRGR